MQVAILVRGLGVVFLGPCYLLRVKQMEPVPDSFRMQLLHCLAYEEGTCRGRFRLGRESREFSLGFDLADRLWAEALPSMDSLVHEVLMRQIERCLVDRRLKACRTTPPPTR